MNALILCAGSARRFYGEEGASRPKCLLSLGEETILSRLLRQVTAQGYSPILGTGCGSELVEAHARENLNGKSQNLQVVFNPDYATTNSIVTLWQLREFVQNDTILINGDVVVDDNVLGLFDQTLNTPQLLVKHLPEFDDDTYRVVFDDGNRVLRMGKELRDEPSCHVAAFLGISRVGDAKLFLREIENLLESGTKNTWPTTAYQRLLGEKPAHAVSIGQALFFDIDTPPEYETARAALSADSSLS
jgi:choline kinase